MNILWHSAPAYFPTGYGVQTKRFVPRIAMAGHDIAVVTMTATIGITWNGIWHIPGGYEDLSPDGLLEWSKRLEPDLAMMLFDIWTLPEDIGSQLEFLGVQWAPITPIEHDPIPKDVLKRLVHAKYPIAMSPFGLREMQRMGLDNARYIPHCVDTNIYKPGEPNKAALDAEDKFVVGVVASNIEPLDRKGWYETMEAFGRFYKKHPDSRLYAHCNVSRADGGIDLTAIATKYGFKIWAPDMWKVMSGIPEETMAEIYRSFDVYLSLTRGEGFGVPLIEAQACGTPVIVTDFTAPSDLVGGGWKVPIVGKRWTPMNSYWANPDIDAAVEALEEAYTLWKNNKLEGKKKEARAFAERFGCERVMEKYMIPFLEEVADEKKKKTKKGNERGREAPDLDARRGGIHSSQLGKKGSPKRRRRRKKR